MKIDEKLNEILSMANKAVEYDRLGDKSRAINLYVVTVEKLLDLAQEIKRKRPDLAINLVSIAEKYLSRVEEIKGARIEVEEDKEIRTKVQEFFLFERPNVRWNEIVGLDEAKKHIMAAVVLPIARGIRGWKGILLYGPPGCGKTMLAKAAATELKATFIYGKIPLIMSKWVGETEKTMYYIFEEARRNQPSIIFLDEIDALLVEESGTSVTSRLRGVILTEMDGLSSKPEEKIVVLAATNRPWLLDPAIRQRFQYRIYIPLPDKEMRKELFKINTKGMDIAEDVDFDKLAEITENYSGREIVTICMEAQLEPWWEIPIEKWSDLNVKPRKICMKDFEKAISKIKPQVTKEELTMYEDFARKI